VTGDHHNVKHPASIGCDAAGFTPQCARHSVPGQRGRKIAIRASGPLPVCASGPTGRLQAAIGAEGDRLPGVFGEAYS
jgi:hypothetical protein